VLNFESGNRLRATANFIADATLARDYARRPYLLDRYGEDGKTRYRQDILYDVAALSAAVDADDAGMFLRYVAWLKIVLVRHGIAYDDIAESLRCMGSAMMDDAANDHSIAASYLHAALEQLDSMPDAVASFIGASSEEHAVARRCLEALLRLDDAAARETLETPIAAGTPLARIYTGILPPLMREIGRLWQMNEITVAHEHYCSAAVQSILSGFYGRMFSATPRSGRSMLVASVEGEQHQLGARTVADVFDLNGWRTCFLGANLPSRDLVTLMTQSHRKPDLIALSATMPAHIAKLASTIAAIRDGSNVPVMVGGYLFDGSPGLAARVGADGCADDAEAALAIADGLVGKAGAIP
jgi:methanogenic corrinoid protein MtbC1